MTAESDRDRRTQRRQVDDARRSAQRTQREQKAQERKGG